MTPYSTQSSVLSRSVLEVFSGKAIASLLVLMIGAFMVNIAFFTKLPTWKKRWDSNMRFFPEKKLAFGRVVDIKTFPTGAVP